MKISEVIKSLPASNAAIKNTASSEPKDGWYPAYSASGQDVWLPDSRYTQRGIVVSAVGARCGKAFKADGEWNICANTHPLSVDETKALRDYCWYMINNEDWWIKGGTAQPFIKVKDSFNRDFDFPSIPEQKLIVKRLDAVRTLIDRKRQQIEKLDELVKARFVEMFGNNKYETRIIKDVLRESFWLMPATPKYIDEGIPYITSKNIKNRILDLDDTKFISENDYVKISKNRPIKPGDILISMIGTLGQIAVVSKNKRFYGQNVYLLRLNNDIISTSFFCEFFNSDDVQNKLAGKSNQSTQAYLKANHVEDLLIPVPPIVIQNDFAAFAAQVDKSKFALSNELAMCNFYVRLINDSITHSRIDLRMSE